MECKRCAECCKWMFITTKGKEQDKEQQQLQKYRGVIQFENCIAIPCVCKKLDKNGDCRLQKQKPVVCIKFHCSTFQYSKELEKIKEMKQ